MSRLYHCPEFRYGLGIQQNITFLLWISELSLLKILTISRFSNLVYLSDWRTEMEMEWMINFLELLVEIRSSAKFIALISAENMEASFRRFLVDNCSTSSSEIAFGAICVNVLIVWWISWMLFSFSRYIKGWVLFLGSLFKSRITTDRSSIPGRVVPKTQKMVLDAAFLNTQHYKVSIKSKVEQSMKWSCALAYTSV